jgi:regulator-associated protein of mTOR
MLHHPSLENTLIIMLIVLTFIFFEISTKNRQSWDLAVDSCLSQLKRMLEDPNYDYKVSTISFSSFSFLNVMDSLLQWSTFFADQLTAFEVWLEFGSESKKVSNRLF